MSAMNPFFASSTLPYQAPPFDMINDEHYRPAFDEALKRKRQEVADIAHNPEPATFDNTFVALEKSGEMLARVTAGPAAVYFCLVVLLTMFAAQYFDPRLLWDKIRAPAKPSRHPRAHRPAYTLIKKTAPTP